MRHLFAPAFAGFLLASLSAPLSAQVEIHDLELTPTAAYDARLDSGVTQTLPPYGAGLDQAPTMLTVGGEYLFVGRRPEFGTELFATTGQVGGTRLVRDVLPGKEGSDPRFLQPHGQDVVFLARDQAAPVQIDANFNLYRTDGTTAGTQPITTLGIGLDGFFGVIAPRILANGRMVIAGRVANQTRFYGVDLATGAIEALLFADIHLAQNFPYDIGLAGDGSFAFVRGFSDTQSGIFRTDGTAAGTLLLHPLGSVPVGPLAAARDLSDGMFAHGGFVYFPAVDATSGLGLYRTDGTTTSNVYSFQPGANLPEFIDLRRAVSLGSQFLLHAPSFVDFSTKANYDYDIFTTDGMSAPSFALGSIYSSYESSPFQVLGGLPYAIVESFDGVRLMRWTPSGEEVVDVLVDATSGVWPDVDWSLTGMFEAQGELYYAAFDAVLGVQVFVRDAAGSTALAFGMPAGYGDHWPTAFGLEPNGELVFWAQGPDGGGALFRALPGAATATFVESFLPTQPTLSSRPFGFTPLGADTMLFFTEGDASAPERQAWARHANGTVERLLPAGAKVIGVVGQLEFAVGFIGGELRAFFAANDAASGTEIWSTNGTAAGTQLAADLTPGAADTKVTDLLVHQGALFAAVERVGIDAAGQARLWAGAPSGLVKLTDARAQGQLATVGHGVVFRAFTAASGAELWHTDGTPAGTALLKDIRPGSASSNVSEMLSLGERALFMASTPADGKEPWITDGTVAGTKLVANLLPGFLSGTLSEFERGSAGNGQEAGFVMHDPPGKLGTTDGTPGGTLLVTVPAAGVVQAIPAPVEHDGWWYFVFTKTEVGQRQDVWRAKGGQVEQMTTLETSLSVGRIRGLAADETRVVALMDTVANGLELHDVLSGGALVVDSIPGPQHADFFLITEPVRQGELGLVGGAAHFRQTDPLRGHELYVVSLEGATVDDLGGRGVEGAELTSTAPELGTTVTLTATDAPMSAGGTAHLLLYSIPTAQPHTLLTMPGGLAWISAAQFKQLGLFLAPNFQFTLPIPNSPAWAGLEANVQVLSWDLTLMLATPSNGLRVRVGG